jgi:hypothetical protein
MSADGDVEPVCLATTLETSILEVFFSNLDVDIGLDWII